MKTKNKPISKSKKKKEIEEEEEEDYTPLKKGSRSQQRFEERLLRTNPYVNLRGRKK